MRCVTLWCLLVAASLAVAVPAQAGKRTVDFPCSQNRADKRFILAGDDWDKKLHELGYEWAEDEYVPYTVLSFTEEKVVDDDWAEGMCRIKLLPVAKY